MDIEKAMQALRDWQPLQPVEISKPDLAGLLKEVTVQSCIRQAAEDLIASASPLNWTAAVGLIGRLWSPNSGAEAAEHTAQILNGVKDTPCFRAAAWAREIPLPALEFIEFSAICEIDRLVDEFDGLQQAVASQDPCATGLAVSILKRRDDLESVAFILRAAGKGKILLEALEGLDEVAVSHIPTFSKLELVPDDRLREVAWQEPLAWWHQVCCHAYRPPFTNFQ